MSMNLEEQPPSSRPLLQPPHPAAWSSCTCGLQRAALPIEDRNAERGHRASHPPRNPWHSLRRPELRTQRVPGAVGLPEAAALATWLRATPRAYAGGRCYRRHCVRCHRTCHRQPTATKGENQHSSTLPRTICPPLHRKRSAPHDRLRSMRSTRAAPRIDRNPSGRRSQGALTTRVIPCTAAIMLSNGVTKLSQSEITPPRARAQHLSWQPVYARAVLRRLPPQPPSAQRALRPVAKQTPACMV